jgi:hypothetical protein
MAEPGLAQRLRRHSRNSGMMIGVSMAAAMIICIAAFIWLYVQIGPLLSDFIPEDPVEEEPGIASVSDFGEPTPDADATDDLDLAEIPPEPLETPSSDDQESPDLDDTGAAAGDDDDDSIDEDEWVPTHELRDGPNVNFRSGPNTISEPQGSLSPGTPLLFLDDEEPASGVVWMFFETEDGTEGWVRDIDVIEIDEDGQPVDDDDQ